MKNYTTIPPKHAKAMQEQASAEYMNTADLWRSGAATEDELNDAAGFADYWDELAEEKVIDLPTYDDTQIGRILQRRCCARCYGHLVQRPAHERRWYAICPECGDAWHGAHISKRTAEMIQRKALADYHEVAYNPALADVLPARQKYTEAELLSQLGF